MVKEKNIIDFEKIISIDMEKIRMALFKYDKTKIVKAAMGSSNELRGYLAEIFADIDFIPEHNHINSVNIQEIENIHEEILVLLAKQK